ncbi:MAG: apolipoprotein N-acyltransferase [Candidatus Lloydbacteria bacterium CG22_combo_CG10-13_8_21_14_all_47_15]|uniref:Apolipoprotein N-acyltransferase n=1 Tax=Candidatus Lloydbacteria bacterium CG22_combo_CG10-13_8_21_14_all_47_15 TaxID=1974635 RepID=A0A2H0CVF6_9BACT|nr:MAG: apolipoprotein N-acyltransferase [Candidatus Lloydbacteria bacterium CG22_combo_CG10-13_8_21_14_all_47_15]
MYYTSVYRSGTIVMNIIHQFLKSIFFAPVLSVLLLWLSLPYMSAGFFVWIALVPLFLFVNLSSTTRKKVFVGALFAGTLYGIAVLYPLASLNAWWWIDTNSFFWVHKDSLLKVFLVLLAAFGGGLFFALFFTAYKQFSTSRMRDVFIFPILWALMEWAREFFVLGFTWGHLGYALHNEVYILQVAKFAGIYGLGFLVVFANMLFYFIFTDKRRRIAAAFVIVAVIFCVSLYGYVVVHAGVLDRQTELRVAVINQNLKTEESVGINGYTAYLELIDEALTGNPDVIVVPENAFPFFVIRHDTRLPLQYDNPDYVIKEWFDGLALLSQEHPDVSLVIGMHTDDDGTRYNSLVVMEDGLVEGVYNKQVLLPLAEESSESGKETHIEPLGKGVGAQEVSVGGRPITPLICSEVIFPRLASLSDSIFIVNISNDSVFNAPLAAKQNHSIAKLRAVENGKYLLRSVKGGISSIINPFGQTMVESGLGERGVLYAVVRVPSIKNNQ